MGKKIILLQFFFIGVILTGNSNIEDKATFFSPVEGRVTYNGEPVSGVKITRRYSGVGDSSYIVENTTTNKYGEYSFGQGLVDLGIMKYLPHEAVISQEIFFNYKDKTYTLWYMVKRNYDLLGELGYLDKEPILSSKMMDGYNNGYIYLNADLSDITNPQGEFQRVDDYIIIASVEDFNFPYEEAIKRYSTEIIFREEEFITPIKEWFLENPDFFSILDSEVENWSKYETDMLGPYIGAKVTGVDSVKFSDHISLWYFNEDYYKDVKRVSIGGEIILRIKRVDAVETSARIWLHDSVFFVSDGEINFTPEIDYFMINPSNINLNSP